MSESPPDHGPADRYELLGELGHGGMATVHLARQLDLDRLVALKRLDGLAGEGDVRARRFVREAKLAGSLSHPNIVTVHDVFEVDGVPHIAMEYVPGGTLRELIVGLSLEQIAGVLDGVLDGLAHAARAHIVHRDLKPENLMVTAEGAIKITDFGIAKATSAVQADDGPLTTAGVAIGTPAYMAPEQAMGREPDPRTDLYAVGVVAFELLAGRPPFVSAESSMQVLMQHVTDPPPPLEPLRPGIDPALSDWVTALLAKDPEQRPADALAARVALEDLLLRLSGPRWRRDAPLPFLPAAAPRPSATATLRRTTDTGSRTRPPLGPLPPEPSRVVAQTQGARRATPRAPRTAMLVVVSAAAAVAIFAGARTVGGAGAPASSYEQTDFSATPSSTATPTATPAATAPAAPSTAAATPAPAAATGTAPAVDVIRVEDADRQSRRFAEEAEDTEGDGDEALTQQLRNAEYAYRDAASAGGTGDAARFNAALAHADELGRAAMARLEEDN